jgi:hypothetical protein
MYSCSYGIRNFVLLICFKVSFCCALGHIHVYCLGYALRMPIGVFFYISDVFLVTSDVRPAASVTFDFIDAAFVIVWGGVVSLSFRQVFYRIGASECFSYVYVF